VNVFVDCCFNDNSGCSVNGAGGLWRGKRRALAHGAQRHTRMNVSQGPHQLLPRLFPAKGGLKGDGALSAGARRTTKERGDHAAFMLD
jgi:hypothetical protein